MTALLLWYCEVFGATLGESLGSISEAAALLSVGFVLLLLRDAVGSSGKILFVDRASSCSLGRCAHVEYSPLRLSATPMSVSFASPMVVADDGTGSDDGVVAGTADQYVG
jgi:hypothetical protein